MVQRMQVMGQQRRELLSLLESHGPSRSFGVAPTTLTFKIAGVPYTALIWRSGVSRDSTVTALMVGRWVDKRMILFRDDEAQELVDFLYDPEEWPTFCFFVEGWLQVVGEMQVPARRPRPHTPGWEPQDPCPPDPRTHH